MGSEYSFLKKPLTPGTEAIVVHDQLSKDYEIPDTLFRTNEKVVVGKSKRLYQSRPTAPPIIVTEVQFRDRRKEVYLVTQLQAIKR